MNIGKINFTNNKDTIVFGGISYIKSSERVALTSLKYIEKSGLYV